MSADIIHFESIKLVKSLYTQLFDSDKTLEYEAIITLTLDIIFEVIFRYKIDSAQDIKLIVDCAHKLYPIVLSRLKSLRLIGDVMFNILKLKEKDDLTQSFNDTYIAIRNSTKIEGKFFFKKEVPERVFKDLQIVENVDRAPI